MSGARGSVLVRHSSFHRDNKSQQKSTTHGRGFFGLGNKHQQTSTKINRVSKSQQKSAKSSPVAGAVSKSHQKSAPFAPFCKQGCSAPQSQQRYWNIKGCVTGGPGSTYKFLLQTDL
jgi:hypothetical protein